MPEEPTTEPRWRFIERTVAVLEGMLAPGASVQHDQQVPELVTGTLRQCDVIVRYGTPPRQTLAAIVEVQDRNDKIGLTTFEGWCAKRAKLGAQRLICVSREGYTEDVVREATSLGDVISLMTLCEPDKPPIFIATTPVFFNATIVHTRNARIVLNPEMPGFTCSCNDKLFEHRIGAEKMDLFSLGETALSDGTAKNMLRRCVGINRYQLTFRVEFGSMAQPLLLRIGDNTHEVKEVHFCDLVEEVQQTLKSTPLAYEQKSVDGALGWVLLSKGSYGGREFYVQQPFMRLPDGTAMLGPPTYSQMAGVLTLSFHSEIIGSNVPES